jgi:hypothetical protein
VITGPLAITDRGPKHHHRRTPAPRFPHSERGGLGPHPQRLTLRNGFAFLFGGGVGNGGMLSLIDCILTGNGTESAAASLTEVRVR